MNFDDHTTTTEETYRKQMIATQAENEMLRHDIKELQAQVYALYKRIAEIIENGNMERNTSNRN